MTDQFFPRPVRSNSGEKNPPVDVIGLAQAIHRAPRRWGVLASSREIEALAETILMLWQVNEAARDLIAPLLELDAGNPGAPIEPRQLTDLITKREQLEAALVEISYCQSEETTNADTR